MKKYKLHRVIGEGASSTVYGGVSAIGEEVAVKVASRRGRSGGMVYREMKMLSSFHHENIVKVVDKFESANHVYIVEELCDLNLVSFLNEYEVDEDVALKILRMILCGLRHIHSMGVIHRDLKLGNILLKGNTVKICDFGLSCYAEENSNEFCGTMDYLAPEVIEGRKYSQGVDIWSAGIVFYVLLTKKKFYESLSSLECSKELKDLLGKLLEKDANKRISASEALMHESFSRFIPRCEDFRDLPNFEKNTRYGVMKKTRDLVELGDARIVARKKERHGSGRRHGEEKCLCGEEFIYSVFIGNEETEPVFVTNGGLKALSLLTGHVKMMRERIPKIIIDNGGNKFYYMFSGGFVYVTREFTLKTRGKGYEVIYLAGEKKYSEKIPDFLYETIMGMKARCEAIDREVCWFLRESPVLVDCSSHQQFSMSYISQVSEMSIRNRTLYDYIENTGWCIRNGLSFLFLMNDGERFEVLCEDLMVRYKERVFPIDNRLPQNLKHYLKRICSFFRGIRDGL
ncbi:Spk1-like Ser/Thr protein kinase [Encephalitozoon intestinalis ATCC 50506]|uniref:Spk1-like Ser/Thr protein kinase n=1 Tax=Encephalitozoon intestinalis (strain ATCC 50506) TaxID=876142 RepID=E0S5R4_ENCIT|nr:Spk1-like Ser/Thr protein kinase [Encephalitozoon intestinalis ATCC 50506]ADM11049.1 Spk1-like Ser/Thr protein kinase [Encephalitozoon intestinalis ATCC 50506]UTX44698.1 protein kinase domain-containing protein [Encephalitozoon intestinalis]